MAKTICKGKVVRIMNSELENFAEEYINDVQTVCQLMLQGCNASSKGDLIKHRGIQANGEFHLNGINRYWFHGRGCRFKNDSICIDWDFGYEDNWCGLDPWKLAYYIRDKTNDSNWADGNIVRSAFDDLVKKGKMEIKHDLYYFT